jgi:hypothetical protein
MDVRRFNSGMVYAATGMLEEERQQLEEMRERENELMREMELQETELRTHQQQLELARREQAATQAEFATMQAKVCPAIVVQGKVPAFWKEHRGSGLRGRC